jgi:hypothetical protein
MAGLITQLVFYEIKQTEVMAVLDRKGYLNQNGLKKLKQSVRAKAKGT